MPKTRTDCYAPAPDCPRFPRDASVRVLRPHLWANKTGVVEKEKDGLHTVLIKGAFCDFQANVPGQMLGEI